MRDTTSTEGAEWRRWAIPIAAAFGCSTAVICNYSLGPFFEPLQKEFGWSRALIASGLTLSGLIGAALSIPVGMLIDRFGPRPIGLAGMTLMLAGFSLLGTATGSTTNWILLWIFVGIAGLLLQPTVWTKAVASTFDRSRGLALALTLSGTSVSATIFPALASWLIAAYGWRTAFPAMGILWAALSLPIVLLFFRTGARQLPGATEPGATDPAAASTAEGLTLKESLRSPPFYKLLIASGLFVFTLMGIVVHFVPILSDRGAAPLNAAGMASLIGIFSFIGRVGTGLLLDRLPGNLVGAGVFLLPIIASLLLLFDGANPVSQAIAAASFGLTLGGEVDVIAYLTTRYLGLKHFGTLFGAMVGALLLGSAFGPLAAAAVFDRFDSYSVFLIATLVMASVSCLALATLGRPRFGGNHAA